mmetsp:Transcript_12278/g.22327  ORF Transcript_12278/g.22327 Transcript_12278/m.22327 type:complete len:139 (-) Transcript_12278:189-605(-)
MKNRQIETLLNGFSKSNVALTFVTIGYAFGVFCRADGKFVVFDTHNKSFQSFGRQESGAYCVLLKDASQAAMFIDNFTLDSRKSIMALAQGFQQSQAATSIDITAIRLKQNVTPGSSSDNSNGEMKQEDEPQQQQSSK